MSESALGAKFSPGWEREMSPDSVGRQKNAAKSNPSLLGGNQRVLITR